MLVECRFNLYPMNPNKICTLCNLCDKDDLLRVFNSRSFHQNFGEFFRSVISIKKKYVTIFHSPKVSNIVNCLDEHVLLSFKIVYYYKC